ncbi:unnamed protein product [Parascedosporium putredinis]|uniref:POPLD-domain-containing protein n=1 Tax=Parascedosporium putredinis TaxID=1442378 RepID=A0A9P1M709_9PEZI|nr:unnamed protein product [Parascedosporium putredinis]CAI7987882.1 unnamed protein product [Parascedosporium putredinis]
MSKRKDAPNAASGKLTRKANGDHGGAFNTGRVVPKRTKFLDARQIAAQPADDALKDGELDLQAFLAARQFEIDALEDSMRRTKEASSSRAFQRLPRKKAKAGADSMDVDGGDKLPVKATITTRPARPKLRRNTLNVPLPVKSKFKKRQITKTWLPTHVWHAKRARMTEPKNPLWRFAVPLTPNEKTYRPTHRAQGESGALVWDVSYTSTIGLYGNVAGIERRKRREVFLRVHPSAFLELFDELLRLIKMETPRLYIEDLRFEVGSIEFTGPASTEVLSGVLVPYTRDGKPMESHGKLFKALTGLTNPASLPANSVLGFSVQDPRLQYPARTVNLQNVVADELLNTLASWPAEDGLQPYQLWSRDARNEGSHLPSKRAIDRRKTNKTPGAYLKATAVDPPIPIILLAQRCGVGRQAQGTWTLLAPWKCIQPLWYSIVHYPLYSGGNPRLGGLREMQQVAFERDQPWFPADYINTNAAAKGKRTAWESVELGASRKGEVGNGLHCDFELLLETGLNGESHMDATTNGKPSSSADAMDVDESSGADATNVVNSPQGLTNISRLSKAQLNDLVTAKSLSSPPRTVVQVRLAFVGKGVATTCARIYRLPARRAPESADPGVVVPATQQATLRPRAEKAPCPQTCASSGSPFSLAPRHLGNRRAVRQPPSIPDLIGFVTTGAFSLSEGKGVAIGSIAVGKVLGELRGGHAKEGTLCVIRNPGESVGRLARWEVI